MNFNSTFGYIFIILFIFYIFRSLKSSASNEVSNIELEKNTISILTFENPIKYGVPIIFLSILITLMGAQLTVNSAIKISNILKISESFLGLTIIAMGTSLPEIATSIRAAKRKKSEIIIGNIIGSNIYNLLLILGASSLFKNFNYDKSILTTEIFLVFCIFLLSILLAINFKFKKQSFNIHFSLPNLLIQSL